MKEKTRRIPKAGWKRRGVGRLLLGLGVVLTGLWLLSGWFDVYAQWHGRGTLAGSWLGGVRYGGLDLNRYGGKGLEPGWVFKQRSGVFRNGWFGWKTATAQDGTTARWITAPLWPLAAGTVGAGFGLSRWGAYARARRRGRCAFCGYDLKGIGEDSPCPECGEGQTK